MTNYFASDEIFYRRFFLPMKLYADFFSSDEVLGPVIHNNDTGLYRDDGLGIFQGISKPMIERKKKLITKNFK